MPQCELSIRSVEMCVDDVIAVCPHHTAQTVLKQFDETYLQVMSYIGLKVKPDDESGFKCFSSLQSGEVLGFLFNTRDLTWSLSVEKNAAIIAAIDAAYDRRNIKAVVMITIKAGQKLVGKLTALLAVCPAIRKFLCFLSRDLTAATKQWPEESKTPQSRQKKILSFSLLAKKDLHLLRAMLAGIHKYWIPIERPHQDIPLIPHLIAHTDASGQLQTPEGMPGPALGVLIPVQPGVIPRAASFPLPRDWLHAKDDVSLNAHNTSFLEAASILCAMIRWPRSFYRRTVLFFTDNASLVCNFRKARPRGKYLCHLLRCLYLVEARLYCTLHITWQARCSSEYSVAADKLSHQDFTGVPDAIQYRVVEDLPAPVLKTLVNSIDFETNQMHKLWPRVKKYWARNAKR